MEDEALLRMMRFVERVDPEIWEWALRATQARAVGMAVGSVFCGLLFVGMLALTIWGFRESVVDALAPGMLVGLIAFVVTFFLLLGAILRFRAPELYAIGYLLSQAEYLFG